MHVCADPSRCDLALDFLTQWAADESFSRKWIDNAPVVINFPKQRRVPFKKGSVATARLHSDQFACFRNPWLHLTPP